MQARMWDCSKTRCPKSWYYIIRAPFLDSRTGKRQVVPHGLFLALFLMDLPVFKTGSIIWSYPQILVVRTIIWPAFNQHLASILVNKLRFCRFFFNSASDFASLFNAEAFGEGWQGREKCSGKICSLGDLSLSLSICMYIYICKYVYIYVYVYIYI